MCLSRSQVISYVTHHKAVKRSCSYPSKILIWYSWCSLFFLIFIFKCFKGWILFCILRLWRQEIFLLYIFMAKEEGLIWKRWILVRNIPLAGEGSWNCIGPYGHRNPRKWSLRRSLRVQGGACDLFFMPFFSIRKLTFYTVIRDTFSKWILRSQKQCTSFCVYWCKLWALANLTWYALEKECWWKIDLVNWNLYNASSR